ncbi:hypothetical protein FSP39_019967 [Pinctada imbricata]|uniref:Mediator of RNA polymerase II transcription subunit 8 n=1 Tax=Pinctada imbricata TaxID=66713 RepID=A0AA88XTG7_PINIB|nr:hypothetical protein FSP39_019967 [Pinctada imbricata]
MIQRVQEIKNSIGAFLFKLENEYHTIQWPNVLDNFALLSGQLNTLGKLLKSEKVPAFQNCVLLPLLLSQDRDAELEKLTEGRVFAFNHAVVPDYLRTKPEPEVEERIQAVCNKATGMNAEMAQKQINAMNKLTSNILDIINSHRESMDSDASQKTSMSQTFSQTDTSNLIAATLTGKGLKTNRRPDIGQQPGTMPNQPQVQQKTQAAMGKAPSSIKTNIKSSSHPYQRN